MFERFMPLDKGLRTHCLFIYNNVCRCLTNNSNIVMKETTITIPMGKADLQEAATAVIEQLATAPPDIESMSQEQSISYNMGLSIRFACLRSTF